MYHVFIHVMPCEIYFRSLGLSEHDIVKPSSPKLYSTDMPLNYTKIMTIPTVVSIRRLKILQAWLKTVGKH